MTSPDHSTDFYRQYAQEYARVSEQFLQSVYLKSSHTRACPINPVPGGLVKQ